MGMRIHTKALDEGHVLLKDLVGKTGNPIIRANTVLTKEFIQFIHAFLIKYVHISAKKENGEIIDPKMIEKKCG